MDEPSLNQLQSEAALKMDDYADGKPTQGSGQFPYGMTEKGKVYQILWPETNEKTIVMSLDTWADFGTLLQSLRAVAANQDRELKRVKAEHSDMHTKLENIRAVRRAEKRADIEQLIAANDPSPTKGSNDHVHSDNS